MWTCPGVTPERIPEGSRGSQPLLHGGRWKETAPSHPSHRLPPVGGSAAGSWPLPDSAAFPHLAPGPCRSLVKGLPGLNGPFWTGGAGKGLKAGAEGSHRPPGTARPGPALPAPT